MDFVSGNITETSAMKELNSVKEKLALLLLACGVVCFGFILPDSLSNHTKLVHFSAHFGMSFLLALVFYMISTVKWKLPKSLSYTILIAASLVIGAFYKYWEIATQNLFDRFDVQKTLELTGAFTSMSQNLSGIMAGMLLIEGLVHKNLVASFRTISVAPQREMRAFGDFGNLPRSNAGNISMSNVGNRRLQVPFAPMEQKS